MIPAAPIVAWRDLATPWRRNLELWAFPGFHHKIISVPAVEQVTPFPLIPRYS
jgi:hypothetical protein